jgi:hypothetical protein
MFENLSAILWTCTLCDDSLIPVVWATLLRYFPKRSASKAKLFFQEFERLLEDDTTSPEHLADSQVEKQLRRVLRLTTMPHCNIELAKTSVEFFSSETFCQLAPSKLMADVKTALYTITMSKGADADSTGELQQFAAAALGAASRALMSRR